MEKNIENKEYVKLLIISALLGVFGIDRIYLKKYKTGILKFALLLVAIFISSIQTIAIIATVVWWLIDFGAIESGRMKDASGKGIKRVGKRTPLMIILLVFVFMGGIDIIQLTLTISPFEEKTIREIEEVIHTAHVETIITIAEEMNYRIDERQAEYMRNVAKGTVELDLEKSLKEEEILVEIVNSWARECIECQAYIETDQEKLLELWFEKVYFQILLEEVERHLGRSLEEKEYFLIGEAWERNF